jgi:hypothetical protein
MSTPKLTERGFVIFGEVTDNRGSVTTVQESSADGEPYCHVFTRDRYGNEVITQHKDPPLSVSPHLTQKQARKLATLLLKFAGIGNEALDAMRENLKGLG